MEAFAKQIESPLQLFQDHCTGKEKNSKLNHVQQLHTAMYLFGFANHLRV